MKAATTAAAACAATLQLVTQASFRSRIETLLHDLYALGAEAREPEPVLVTDPAARLRTAAELCFFGVQALCVAIPLKKRNSWSAKQSDLEEINGDLAVLGGDLMIEAVRLEPPAHLSDVVQVTVERQRAYQ